MAKRYAALKGYETVPFSQLANSEGDVTVVLPIGMDPQDVLTRLWPLHGLGTKAWPICSFLVGESLASLALLMAKHLVPDAMNAQAETHVFSNERMGGGATYPDAVDMEGLSGDQIASQMTSANGTLLIGGHSRPHCGLFPTQDGLIGLCAMPDGGASGRCLQGTACFFKGRPIVPLQSLKAERVFYNGCTTAGTSTRRPDLLDASEMIAHAVLRGPAREYVGNLRAGRYSDQELSWFAALSAHGLRPAECVRLIEARRGDVGTEKLPSLVHFGDVQAPPWPVSNVEIAQPTYRENTMTLAWTGARSIKTALITDPAWLLAMGAGKFTIQTQNAEPAQIAVLESPFDSALYVLLDCGSSEPARLKLTRQDTSAAPDFEAAAGACLSESYARLAELARYPAFRDALGLNLNDLENLMLTEQWELKSSTGVPPQSTTNTSPGIQEALRHTNACILTVALAKCSGKWSWQDEYLDRTLATPESTPGTCPTCGGATVAYQNASLLNPALRRRSVACGICGIVQDQPDYGLSFTLQREGLITHGSEFSGTVRVANTTNRSRDCILAATVRGAQTPHANNAITAFSIAAQSATSVPFHFSTQALINEVVQCWVMIVCDGDIGFAGRISAMRSI
ncbi:hypothetical protein [Leisingera sp. ANG-Vp]|uniref:hypothetical protein n=1 Tax=Leisingera sp. ANG-Vp TaxID=1577896 RepID=UPI00126A1941|nr:hypothetical protein [Leisingera sp. ANG-Vp]